MQSLPNCNYRKRRKERKIKSIHHFILHWYKIQSIYLISFILYSVFSYSTILIPYYQITNVTSIFLNLQSHVKYNNYLSFLVAWFCSESIILSNKINLLYYDYSSFVRRHRFAMIPIISIHFSYHNFWLLVQQKY